LFFMKKANGKSPAEVAGLDPERELPAADEEQENSGGAVSLITEQDWQKMAAERDSLLDRLARLQAEFENARKRASREQQDFRDYAVVDTIKVILPVVDSFERALRAPAEAEDFRGGVELIYKQLEDALAKLGVRAIPAKGEQFDPHFHEAIEMVETSDAEDHEVLEEWQRGYKFKDRLVRPAMVKVAKNPGK